MSLSSLAASLEPAIALAAGYPISPADLWAASDAEPEELSVEVFVREES